MVIVDHGIVLPSIFDQELTKDKNTFRLRKYGLSEIITDREETVWFVGSVQFIVKIIYY